MSKQNISFIFILFSLFFMFFISDYDYTSAHSDKNFGPCSTPTLDASSKYEDDTPSFSSSYTYDNASHSTSCSGWGESRTCVRSHNGHYSSSSNCTITISIVTNKKHEEGWVKWKAVASGRGASKTGYGTVYWVKKADLTLQWEGNSYDNGISGTTSSSYVTDNGNYDSKLTTYSDQDVPKVVCLETRGDDTTNGCHSDTILETDENKSGQKGIRKTCYYIEDPYTSDSDKICTTRVYVTKVEIQDSPTKSYTGLHHKYSCLATFYDGKTRDVTELNEKYVWLSYPQGKDMKTFYDGRYIGSSWVKKEGYTDPRGEAHKPYSLHDFYPADPENRTYNVNCTYYPGLDWVLQYYGGDEGLTNWVRKQTNLTNDANELYFYLDEPIYQAKKFNLIDDNMYVHPQHHGGYKTQIYVRDLHTRQWVKIFDHQYSNTTYLGGMITEFPARDIDAVRFDSNRDVNQNYHGAGGAIVAFYIEKPVSEETIQEWDRITHLNSFISDYDLQGNEPWHIPKHDNIVVNHYGIKDMKVSVQGQFSVDDGIYESKTYSPVMNSSYSNPDGWSLNDSITNEWFQPGVWNQSEFLTAHWYNFKAEILYGDNTDGNGSNSYRDITNVSEVYWKNDPWFEGEIFPTTKRTYDSQMSKKGIDHRIPQNKWNDISVEFFHQNVPFGDSSYGETRLLNRLWSHQMSKLEIRGQTDYESKPRVGNTTKNQFTHDDTRLDKTEIKTGDTINYTAWITWTDDPDVPDNNPFTRGKKENWSEFVVWKGDYVNNTPGQYTYNVSGLGTETTISAYYGDADDTYSDVTDWDDKYDKLIVQIDDCSSVEHIAYDSENPQDPCIKDNYWRTLPDNHFVGTDKRERPIEDAKFEIPHVFFGIELDNANYYGGDDYSNDQDFYFYEVDFPVSGMSTGQGNY